MVQITILDYAKYGSFWVDCFCSGVVLVTAAATLWFKKERSKTIYWTYQKVLLTYVQAEIATNNTMNIVVFDVAVSGCTYVRCGI